MKKRKKNREIKEILVETDILQVVEWDSEEERDRWLEEEWAKMRASVEQEKRKSNIEEKQQK